MKQFFAYLTLQWKRCTKTVLRSCGILGGILAAVALLLFGMFRLLGTDDGLHLIKVGVVIPEGETASQYVVQFISSMESVKSVCEFEYADEKTAVEKFQSGEYQAAVVLPENFYHDVQVGLNPPARIYFPENPGLVGSLFRALLTAGVSYLQSAESGVYAVLDAAFLYDTSVSISDIGNQVALSYVNAIFSRDKLFEGEALSVFGDIGMDAYYYAAGMLLLLLFSGVVFAFLYGKNARVINDRLRINGMNGPLCMLARILTMLPAIFLFGTLLYFLGTVLSRRFDRVLVLPAGTFFPAFLLLSLTVAFYFELLYLLSGNGRAGRFVLMIVNIIGATSSGLILPQAYLSGWTRTLGNLLPMKYWMRLLCFGSFRGGPFV